MKFQCTSGGLPRRRRNSARRVSSARVMRFFKARSRATSASSASRTALAAARRSASVGSGGGGSGPPRRWGLRLGGLRRGLWIMAFSCIRRARLRPHGPRGARSEDGEARGAGPRPEQWKMRYRFDEARTPRATVIREAGARGPFPPFTPPGVFLVDLCTAGRE